MFYFVIYSRHSISEQLVQQSSGGYRISPRHGFHNLGLVAILAIIHIGFSFGVAAQEQQEYGNFSIGFFGGVSDSQDSSLCTSDSCEGEGFGVRFGYSLSRWKVECSLAQYDLGNTVKNELLDLSLVYPITPRSPFFVFGGPGLQKSSCGDECLPQEDFSDSRTAAHVGLGYRREFLGRGFVRLDLRARWDDVTEEFRFEEHTWDTTLSIGFTAGPSSALARCCGEYTIVNGELTETGNCRRALFRFFCRRSIWISDRETCLRATTGGWRCADEIPSELDDEVVFEN